MPESAHDRPVGVMVAVAGTVVVALALVGLAVASLAAGHGGFSGGVGLALIVYGAGMLAAAWALWRLNVFGRGPVVALALLNLVAGWTFTATAPWVWLLVAISAVTVVAGSLPSTSRALHLRRERPTPADEPRQTDDPGR